MTERTTFHPQWVKNTKIIPASHPREASTVQHANARVHIVLDDYQTTKPVPDNSFTLILTHGTSFSRVFWEAVMADLVSRSALNSSIKRVIAVDAVNHGDSAVYNTGKLSSRAFWPDISRDILTALDTLDVSGPIVGIGHSFGGGALLHAAMMAPNRFTATILVEPILFQMKEKTRHVARLALRRRDCWDTLRSEEVVASFRKSFHDWDLNQLDKYIHDCTRFVKCDNDKGYWTLKTPKEQEAATYLAAPYPRILELLDQSLQRHYFIFGGKSKVIDVENREKVKLLYPRPGSVTIVPDAGHLIPMTHPKELSKLLERQLLEIRNDIGSTLRPLSRI